MKKTLCCFIFLVMVAGFFSSCVSSQVQYRNTMGPVSMLPVGKIANQNIFIDLGIDPQRWKKEAGFSGGYSRGGFPEFKAYYFPDKKKFVNYTVLISDKDQETMNEEMFQSLINTELVLYYKDQTVKKSTPTTSLLNVKIGEVPALFISMNSHLSDGRNRQMSFAGMNYAGKTIFMIFTNHEDDSTRKNHTEEILRERIPQIVFEQKPLGNIS